MSFISKKTPDLHNLTGPVNITKPASNAQINIAVPYEQYLLAATGNDSQTFFGLSPFGYAQTKKLIADELYAVIINAVQQIVLDPNQTIPTNQNAVKIYNINGIDQTQTAVPTIALPPSSVSDYQTFIFTVINAGSANNFILQDDSILSGSKLALAGRNNLVLKPGEVVQFVWVTDKWVQLSYSGAPGGGGGGSSSSGALGTTVITPSNSPDVTLKIASRTDQPYRTHVFETYYSGNADQPYFYITNDGNVYSQSVIRGVGGIVADNDLNVFRTTYSGASTQHLISTSTINSGYNLNEITSDSDITIIATPALNPNYGYADRTTMQTTLYNVGSYNITLPNDSGNGSGLLLPTPTIVIGPNQSVTFMWSPTNRKWKPISPVI